ncbi:MAG: ATP-binding cassette domain-containing protein [Pseudomonadota bacterium]
MLKVTDLMVFYENALALDSLCLEVGPGEMRGVIGSNSAGKSTLMHALSGLILDIKTKEARRGGERISLFGRVEFQGLDITGIKPSERVRLGIVLCRERHPVFHESSVAENLKIGGHLRPRAETREKMDFIFTLFPQLRTHRRKSAGFLSGGEQQMLALGMALMAGPRLLLLDEPLLGLSPLLQKQLVQAILLIRRETGVTVLVSEQYARPILPVLDFAYVLEHGMLSLSGPGPELMANPEVRAAYFGV